MRKILRDVFPMSRLEEKLSGLSKSNREIGGQIERFLDRNSSMNLHRFYIDIHFSNVTTICNFIDRDWLMPEIWSDERVSSRRKYFKFHFCLLHSRTESTCK